MPTYRDFTSSRFEYRTYKLGRSLLDRLFAVASEGADPNEVEYSTRRSGTTFTRASLEDLVSAVAASPTPGDPEIWSDLSFQYHHGSKSVRIEINHLWLSISVRGDDATWVHGQAARIRALVEPVSGEEAAYQTRHRTLLKFGLFAGGVAWLSSFFVIRNSSADESVAKNILDSLMIGMLLFLLISLLGLFGKGKSKTFLNVVGEVNDVGWWRNLDVMERIAFGALVVTVLAAIGTLGSAYSDLWGGK
ncbi:hypothetical protein ACIQVA_00040 [Streptomyces microflavus]|uniref:hypothetical protein n=1 Tax=Streptomyces microflavus TaxID=1919 RepID=UPI0037FC3887